MLWCFIQGAHILTHHTSPDRVGYLREALLTNVALLDRRRAGQIGDSTIDEYLALQWFEWNGGALRLTVVGQNICEQIRAEARATIE